MEYAVAFMIGVSGLTLGFSLIIHHEIWREWLRRLRVQGAPIVLLLGYWHLIVGTFIVTFHSKWSGWPLLVTLVGVKAIMEGMFYTLSPNNAVRMLEWCEARQYKMIRAMGVVTLIIAMVALNEWLHYMQEICDNLLFAERTLPAPEGE
jgi:hypothetical protein